MFFDAHADILTDIYQQRIKGNTKSFIDRHLEHYKQAGITHSIFVNWTDPSTDNPTLFDDIFHHALIDLHDMEDIFHIVYNYHDMAKATKLNKIGVIIGIEGIKQLRDVNHLRELYKRGVRHASLTWNDVNKYAAGLSDETGGLTLLGKEVLTEMEHLGMIIDLAHASPRTFQDILDHTTEPIIISHGNTKALCDHIRNYTNDQLQAIKERDGVVGICGIASFISSDKDKQTIEQMVHHIDHTVKTIGIDHVGIGLDVCYYLDDDRTSNNVDGFSTIADANNIFIELRKRGYSKKDINKIKYDNFARVVKHILR